jgi:hypothetical protein
MCISLVGECKICGVEFARYGHGRPQIYCSPKCRNRSYNGVPLTDPLPRPCIVCGGEFTPKQNRTVVCSSQCRSRRDNGTVLPKPRPCSMCGKEFTPKCNKVLQCSNSCRHKAKAKIHGGVGYRFKGDCVCIWCGKGFEGDVRKKTGKQLTKFCSAECQTERHVSEMPEVTLTCEECGKTATRKGGNGVTARFCSRFCTQKNACMRRRILKRKAFVETVTPGEIYERDGWVCQICGDAVSPSAAYPSPRSASLDHRTPLSAGGKHSRDNCQLAHLRCNILKHDKIA